MGWSAKHGLRPNRPRPLREPGTRKIIKRPPREPGYRVVGVLTEVATGVRRIWSNGVTSRRENCHYERHMWSRDWRLHPTKGYRVESPIRKSVETSPNSRQPEGWKLGMHVINTFKRAAA